MYIGRGEVAIDWWAWNWNSGRGREKWSSNEKEAIKVVLDDAE
jgi:hypothetical protein